MGPAKTRHSPKARRNIAREPCWTLQNAMAEHDKDPGFFDREEVGTSEATPGPISGCIAQAVLQPQTSWRCN